MKTPKTIARLATLRREKTALALAARRERDALLSLGFYWLAGKSRAAMRQNLYASRLYRNA